MKGCSPDYPVAKCMTCQGPLRYRDEREWSWLDLRKHIAEHDDCYDRRFAVAFPEARKPQDAAR